MTLPADLTLRDLFAAAALVGIAAVRNYAFDINDADRLDYAGAADDAYAYADEMLIKRAKGEARQ